MANPRLRFIGESGRPEDDRLSLGSYSNEESRIVSPVPWTVYCIKTRQAR